MNQLKIASLDPSLLNWGVVIFSLDTDTYELEILSMQVIQVKPSKDKNVRKSLRDIERIREILAQLIPLVEDVDIIVAEAPIGGRDTSSAFSYAVCVSLLSVLDLAITDLFTVTPFDVKKVVKKDASKAEMIEWATTQHPEAPWKTRVFKGKSVIVAGYAEHLADAVATLYAAATKPQFINLIESKS